MFIASLSIQFRRAGVQKKFGGRAGRANIAKGRLRGVRLFRLSLGLDACAIPMEMKNPACEAVRREAEEDWGR